MKKFMRKNEYGEIDLEKSKLLVRELATAAHFYPDHNIMVDLREKTVSEEFREKLMDIVVECANMRPHSFDNKIAAIVPDEPERRASSEMFETGMKIQNFKYRVFTDFEKAINWLSENL